MSRSIRRSSAALLLIACGSRTGLAVEDGGAPEICVPSGSTIDVCNGIDDDCDGAIDEDVDVTALRLSDPIVLRSVGEGAVGTCRTCGQVIDADVALIDGELHVVWNVMFDAHRPMPNMFRRRVGLDGEIRGPAERVGGMVSNHLCRTASSGGANATVAFCERGSDDDDHAAAAIAGSSGVGAPFRLGGGRGCRAELLRAVWNGQRFAFVQLADSARVLLHSVEPRSGIVTEDDLGMSDAVGIGGSSRSVIVLLPRIRTVGPELRFSALEILRTDLETRPAGTLTRLDDGGSLAVNWRLPMAVWDGEAWRLFGGGGGGTTTARMAGDGSLIEAPHVIDDTFVREHSAAALGEGLVARAARIDEARSDDTGSLVIVDRDGTIVRRWGSSELGEGAWLHPNIQAFGGVAALVYSTGSELDHDVRMRLLACVP